MTANTQRPTEHDDEHQNKQQAAYSPNESSESSKNHDADEMDEFAKNLTDKKGKGKGNTTSRGLLLRVSNAEKPRRVAIISITDRAASDAKTYH